MLFADSLKLVAETLTKVQTSKQFQGVLEDLCTPQEIVDIAERIKLLQEIQKGKTQREVAEEL